MTKEEIGSILKDLRVSCGKTQKEVAELLGRKQQIIGHWETGYSQPDANTLFTLCDIYKTTVDRAFGFHQKNELEFSSEDLELLKQYQKLDVYGKNVVNAVIKEELKRLSDVRKNIVNFNDLVDESKKKNYKKRMRVYGKISAGLGVEAIEDYEEVYGPDRADFALVVSGDSMEPEFTDQQVIYIKKTSQFENGQIMAVQVEDDFFMQAYLKIVEYDEYDDDKIRLISLNDSYDDQLVDAELLTVIGMVVE